MAASEVFLFKPQDAWRFRWNKNTDTPIPPDEAAGQNPPDGAVIDFWLKTGASGPVTLEILDASGAVVRRYSSEDKAEPVRDEGNVPACWIRPPQVLSAAAGMHRFIWDVHYAPPKVASFSYPIAATPHNTARVPAGPWAMPGTFTRLE